MTTCFFVSDLHGRLECYEKLLKRVAEVKPAALFLGGDFLPSNLPTDPDDSPAVFLQSRLLPLLRDLRVRLARHFPRIFLIMGNDDGRFCEQAIHDIEHSGIWEYVASREAHPLGDFRIFGYPFVPPTPFLLKDWERYDVSRYVDPGCVSPEEGFLTCPREESERKHATIKDDLNRLTNDASLHNAILLFHAPPYRTLLDRAALDGVTLDGVPLDVHVGSIAVRKFIEERQPLLTLHGHVHESAAVTGSWKDGIGRTRCFSAAHDGPELALVRFELENLDRASRELI